MKSTMLLFVMVTEFSVRMVILILLVWLSDLVFCFTNTSVVVLIIGIISFSVGILYTFGPIPFPACPWAKSFQACLWDLLFYCCRHISI